MFNKSTPYHFVGAFFFASFARLMVSAGWIGGWIAFWIVFAAGVIWEIGEYERWRKAHPEYTAAAALRMYYWADSVGDVMANAGGAALAIFPGWWYVAAIL